MVMDATTLEDFITHYTRLVFGNILSTVVKFVCPHFGWTE